MAVPSHVLKLDIEIRPLIELLVHHEVLLNFGIERWPKLLFRGVTALRRADEPSAPTLVEESKMEMKSSTGRWQDQTILLLGIWFFVSPWVLGYAGDSPQAINAYVAGLVIAVLAAFDLYKTFVWAVVLNLLVGVWVAVSPWIPAIADRGSMMNNSLIVGLAVVLLALWELRSDPELHRQWAGR